MQRLVYYISHWESDKRIGYHKTLGGARIAMRNRNRLLGFQTRVGKLKEDTGEYELYSVEDSIVRGTYSILEDYIEMENLYNE